MEKFYCDGLVIRDEQGRERLFRGFNCCIKKPKQLASDLERFTRQISVMLENGANIIRLGVTWEAIEPKAGQLSGENIALIRKFVKKCEENGVYVMLDMHQDLYSARFPRGDGAPLWAVDKALRGKKPFAVWAEGYFYMDAVQQAFSDFWQNKAAVQDKFISAWQQYSAHFKDCENVIGLDYFNEPFVDKNGRKIFLELLSNVSEIACGRALKLEKYFEKHSDKAAFALTALKIAGEIKSAKRLRALFELMDSSENFGAAVTPLSKYTKDFNREVYQPFFDKISAAAGLDGKFNFFEHNYYSNLGIAFEMKTAPSYVYSPHAYDIFIDSLLYNKYSSNARVAFILRAVRQNQMKMQVPVLFGEWGGGAKGEAWVKHIDFVMGEFEKYHWSSIYWGFRFKNEKLVAAFNRPYPVAVCGDIKEMKTDTQNRRFLLRWETPRGADFGGAKTLVYIPAEGVREFDFVPGENKIEIGY